MRKYLKYFSMMKRLLSIMLICKNRKLNRSYEPKYYFYNIKYTI